MSEHESLPALRRALTADDPDRRAEAYGDVMSIDIQPSEVLEDDPDEAVVNKLRAEGIIPAEAEAGIPVPEYHKQVLELLKSIEANTGGS